MKKTVKRGELDFGVDRNRLDDEWVGQPQLRYDYGVQLADAKAESSVAKADLELTAAELDKEIREDPESFGVAKVSEAAVKAVVLSNVRYTRAKNKLIDAQHSVDVIEAAVSAIDHRKKALEDLVALYLGGYYGNPRAPEGAKERMADVEKQAVRGKGRRLQED